MGRLPYQLGYLFKKHPAQSFFGQSCSERLTSPHHVHIDNYGNYIPGFCGGISMGKIYKLDQLLVEGIESDKYPILNYLINDDFEAFFQFAQDFGYQQPKDGYFSKCHLCVDIRKHLVTNTKQKFKELEPEEFYKHIS